MQNFLNHLQFQLRKNWTGKLRLRSNLPPLPHSPGALQSIEKERMYYHLLLSRSHLKNTNPLWFNPPLDVIDIGCRNWSYAKAISDFFPHARITGIELDGYRRYWNLYRRMDFAEAYAKELRDSGKKVQFWAGDFLDFDFNSSKVLFCFFYPFVCENPCIQWGLPSRYVCFSEMLHHTQSLKKKYSIDIKILSAHQGEWEAEEARKIYRSSGHLFRETLLSHQETSPFWPSPYDTHLFLVES